MFALQQINDDIVMVDRTCQFFKRIGLEMGDALSAKSMKAKAIQKGVSEYERNMFLNGSALTAMVNRGILTVIGKEPSYYNTYVYTRGKCVTAKVDAEVNIYQWVQDAKWYRFILSQWLPQVAINASPDADYVHERRG